MSLSRAIELIWSELPEPVAEAIGRAESSDSATELTVPGFSVWHMKAPENVKFVCERRLIGCEIPAIKKWLSVQLDFLDKSFAAGTTHELWQSYCVTDLGRIAFMIDT